MKAQTVAADSSALLFYKKEFKLADNQIADSSLIAMIDVNAYRSQRLLAECIEMIDANTGLHILVFGSQSTLKKDASGLFTKPTESIPRLKEEEE